MACHIDPREWNVQSWSWDQLRISHATCVSFASTAMSFMSLDEVIMSYICTILVVCLSVFCFSLELDFVENATCTE